MSMESFVGEMIDAMGNVVAIYFAQARVFKHLYPHWPWDAIWASALDAAAPHNPPRGYYA